MAYLYFSKLNQETTSKETSLYAATANSGLVFCVQNDKSIFDILKGQDFFQKLLGQEKFNQLSLLKNKLIANPAVNNLIGNRNVFISFSAGTNKETDYLISTQLNNELEKPKLINALKSNGINVDQENGIMKLVFNDSTAFYLNVEKNLILLSNSPAPVKAAMTAASNEENNQFVAYIKSSNKFSKNSLGNLYIDFNKIPALLKSMLPGQLNGGLSVFNHQNSFSTLNYNFSKERLFFNGGSQLNDKKNYLTLFASLAPQKNNIDNLLPEHTANFQLYALTSYADWRKELNNWFLLNKEDQKIKIRSKALKRVFLDSKRLSVFFKTKSFLFSQITENMAAINLTNGDKVSVITDMSDDYSQDTKDQNQPLYCYFGQPFKSLSRPYYR